MCIRDRCEPALEPRGEREGSSTKCQGFKPDLRNSAVRHYRGAQGNVARVELGTRPAIERAGAVTLHLQRSAPYFYPSNTVNGHKVISHAGGIEGFNTLLAYYPEDKLTVVVLANLNGQGPT